LATVVGVGTGAAGKLLGTWASFGGTGAGLTSFGFKSALAFAGGYYGASEVDAIARSERPGARAALTTLDVAGFTVGARFGSLLVPRPVVTSARVTSTKGSLIEQGGSLTGTISVKGYKTFDWFGSRKLDFTASETYGGGKFSGVMKYASGVSQSYGGSLVRFGDVAGPSMLVGHSGRQATLFQPEGTESVTFSRAGLTRLNVQGEYANVGGKSGSFLGYTDKGKGFMKIFERGPAPTGGFLTFASGEAATMFQPGGFSGVGLFESGAIARPGSIADFGAITPSLPSVPSFGAYARGFDVPSSFGFLGVPSVSSQQRSMVSVQSLSSPTSFAVSGPTSFSMAVPVIGSTSGSISEPIHQPVVDAGAITHFGPGSFTGVDWGGGGGSSNSSPPWEPPPMLPFVIGPPGFGFGMGRKGRGSRGNVQFQTKYNPSLIGADFKIRGSRSSASFAAMTGVAVRPIV
jgi:hypothetical protein